MITVEIHTSYKTYGLMFKNTNELILHSAIQLYAILLDVLDW